MRLDRQQADDDATFRHMNQHDNEHNHEHDHDNDDDIDDDEHSPESAGLARGLARSAASRSAVGRLPASSSAKAGGSVAKATARTHVRSSGMRVRPRATMPKPTSTSMANKMKMRGGAASRVKVRSPATAAKSAGGANKAIKVPPSRGGGAGGRVNVRRIAKASDRASTGLDLVEAASSEEGSSKLEVQRQDLSVRVKDVMRRVPAFMATLAKNTVLGMAVFATYESVVEYEWPSSSPASSSSANDGNGEIVPFDPLSSASLSWHVTAGFLAGTAHAVVNYTMDGMMRMRTNILGGLVTGTVPASSPFVPYMMHHAISHGILFGSYEGTKRMLIPFLASGVGGENNHHRDNHGDDDENVHYSNLLAIGLAGGIAGTAQHIVSEYTETTFVASYTKICQAKGLTFSERLQLLPRASLPSVRALAMAFLPSSIGFVAFEYGKEFVHMSSEDVGTEQ